MNKQAFPAEQRIREEAIRRRPGGLNGEVDWVYTVQELFGLKVLGCAAPFRVYKVVSGFDFIGCTGWGLVVIGFSSLGFRI